MPTGVDTPRSIEFSADAREIWGEAIGDLERLDEMFSPHSFDEFQHHPSMFRDICAQSQPLIERCKTALRKFLMTNIFGRENPDKHRRPHTDGIQEFMRALKSLTDVYPAYAKSDVPFIQALYLNLIFYGVVSELFAHFHNNRGDKRVQRCLSAFSLGEQTQETSNRTSWLLREIPSTDAFFQQHAVPTFPTSHLSLAELQTLNGRLFAAINQFRQYDVPLSVAREEDVCNTPICLVSDQPSSSAAQSGIFDAELNLYDASFETILTDRGTLDRMRTQPVQESMDGMKKMIHGKSVQLAVDRFRGEISATTLSPEALKILLGEKTYETLRAYILFRYAQLVCDDKTFVREFRDFITLIDPPQPDFRKGSRRQAGNGPMPIPPAPPESPQPWKGKLPLRFFPRAARRYLRGEMPATTDDAGAPTGRMLRGHRTEAHRRLLPAEWKPTQQAQAKAREEGADLLSSFEIAYEILDREFRFADSDLYNRFCIGEFIFDRDDFMREASARGTSFDSLLSDLIAENHVRERQFTYVTGHQFGNVTEAVRARFRYDLGQTAGLQTPPTPNPEHVEASDTVP
ncbi:hypothetical protein HYW83_02095 [Candidatus Peregrinibacteria bacterium]|nr:hypothetical protein [Candidatus Peregrinibacteria bacterium]